MADKSAESRSLMPHEVNLLLAHLVRLPDVLTGAIPYLRFEDFDQVTERKQRTIYDLTVRFYRNHQALPSYQMLVSALDAECNPKAGPEFQDVSVVHEMKTLLYHCFTMPAAEFNKSWAFETMQRFAFDRRIRPNIGLAQNTDMLVDLAYAATSLKLEAGAVVSPFGSMEALLGVADKQRTGVNLIDNLLGGGVKPKEIYGLIAPSGGGKTTLINQMGVEYAKSKRHYAVFQYEESPGNADFMLSVYCCATGIKRSRMAQIKTVADFTADERDLFEKAKKDIGNYLHFVDMSSTVFKTGGGGPSEIDAVIRNFKQQGIELAGMAIDWFLPMAKRCYGLESTLSDNSSQKRKTKSKDERQHFHDLMDEIKRIAGTHNIWIWVANQVAAAEATKNKKKDWNDSAEFKGMAFLTNYFFALSPLVDDIGELNLSKGRGVKGTKVSIHLDGERARFIPIGDDLHWDPRQKKYIKKGQERVIPSAKPVDVTPVEKKVADMMGGQKGAADF